MKEIEECRGSNLILPSALLPTLTAWPTISCLKIALILHFVHVAHENPPDTARIDGGFPAATQRVQVRTTDTAMGDLDVDVGFLPFLRLISFPFHVPLGGRGIMSEPTLEFVIGRHVVRE